MQTIRVRTQNVFIEYPRASVRDRTFTNLIDKAILHLYAIAIVAIFVKLEFEDPWYPWLLLLGFPWLFFNLLFEIFINGSPAINTVAIAGKGQRLAGVAAVVKLVENHAVTTQNVFVQVAEQYTPTFNESINFSEKDIALVQRVEANGDQGNIQHLMIITDKIKTLLKIETDLPRVKFLARLIKDYQTITAG